MVTPRSRGSASEKYSVSSGFWRALKPTPGEMRLKQNYLFSGILTGTSIEPRKATKSPRELFEELTDDPDRLCMREVLQALSERSAKSAVEKKIPFKMESYSRRTSVSAPRRYIPPPVLDIKFGFNSRFLRDKGSKQNKSRQLLKSAPITKSKPFNITYHDNQRQKTNSGNLDKYHVKYSAIQGAVKQQSLSQKSRSNSVLETRSAGYASPDFTEHDKEDLYFDTRSDKGESKAEHDIMKRKFASFGQFPTNEVHESCRGTHNLVSTARDGVGRHRAHTEPSFLMHGGPFRETRRLQSVKLPGINDDTMLVEPDPVDYFYRARLRLQSGGTLTRERSYLVDLEQKDALGDDAYPAETRPPANSPELYSDEEVLSEKDDNISETNVKTLHVHVPQPAIASDSSICANNDT